VSERVTEWLSQVIQDVEFDEPVVEFGSLQSPERRDYAGIRKLFAGKAFIGCDVQQGPGVDMLDDLERSRFGPGEVGAVVCLEALDHVKRPWLAVQEVHRILKPGGLFLISVPFRMPTDSYPGDYWRMTAKALEVLLKDAGFVEVEVSDTGDKVAWDLNRGRGTPEVDSSRTPSPYISFAIARKAAENRETTVERVKPDSIVEKMNPSFPHKMVENDKRGRNVTRSREKTPIVVPVFHREEDTKLMFKQLSKVTDNYSMIIVNNGFDDRKFLEKLKPLHYIENKENTGAIRPINQGLEVADGEYVAVLHNDLLIFDEGWLDHIIEFMERRRDVGLVGLGGRHTINADGMYDNDTTVAGTGSLPLSYKPTWRLTEVATIDGLGWVMRNIGLRLDESFGLMHFYDLDLSLQFIDAGYRVYVAAVDITHLADDNERSTRSHSDYLDRIGGDDSSYFDEVQEKFRKKWQHMLPITRGFKDESSAYQRIAELYELLDGLRDHIYDLRDHMDELGHYARELEAEDKKKRAEIEKATRYVRMLENEDSKRLAENERLSKYVGELEKRPSIEGVSAERTADHPERSDSTRRSAVAKFKLYMESEGLAKTLKRTALYIPKKAGLLRRENSQQNRH